MDLERLDHVLLDALALGDAVVVAGVVAGVAAVLVALAVRGQALPQLAVEQVAQLEQAADDLGQRRRIALAWDVRSPDASALASANRHSGRGGDAAADASRLESGTARALGGDSAPGRSCGGTGPLASGGRRIVITEPGLLT